MRAGALLPQRDDGRLHRRAGREPVVHENDRAIADRDRPTRPAILHVPPFQFETLTNGHLLDHGMRHTESLDDVPAEHPNAALCDGAHCQLLMPRHAELANEEHIQRRAQSRRYFMSDRHTAPWQTEDDDVRTVSIWRQRGCELPARIDSIVETHGDSPRLIRLTRTATGPELT